MISPPYVRAPWPAVQLSAGKLSEDQRAPAAVHPVAGDVLARVREVLGPVASKHHHPAGAMDRAAGSGPEGCGFESRAGSHLGTVDPQHDAKLGETWEQCFVTIGDVAQPTIRYCIASDQPLVIRKPTNFHVKPPGSI